MQFAEGRTTAESVIRLNFYNDPPIHETNLSEIEELALNRIKVLKIFEYAGQDYLKGSSEYMEKIFKELNKLGNFGKIFLHTSYQTKNAQEEIHIDNTSQFLLQVAYCRADELKRWFINQELDLFRYRFNMEKNQPKGAHIINKFLEENNLSFHHIDEKEKAKFSRELISCCLNYPKFVHESTVFYKVDFTSVPDLVRARKVFVHGGFAYVPDYDMISLVATQFRSHLSHSISKMHLSINLDNYEHVKVLSVLTNASRKCLGDQVYTKSSTEGKITAEEIEKLARQPGLYPPCMSRLHEGLKTSHHLKHQGRMQYGLFLKGIGVPLDESLRFWRNSFAPKLDADTFSKQYSYNIRHNYGKEGKRVDYAPYSCYRIIMGPLPGVGDVHGCPFKHMDPILLKQRLSSGGVIPSDLVSSIIEKSKLKMYHLACRDYFRGVNKLSAEQCDSLVINHPNVFYDEAIKVSKGAGLSAPKAVSKPAQKVKIGRNNPNGKSDLNNSQFSGDDMSIIESSIMDEF